MKTINKVLLLLAIGTFLCCKKNKTTEPDDTINNNTNNQPSDLIKIGETYIIGAKTKAVIYSKKAFETGYNELYISMFDSIDGKPVNAGHLQVTPLMNMGTMIHSAPVENSADTLISTGYYRSAVVFIMPGNATQWSLNLFFHNHKNNLEGTGKLGIEVISSTPSKMKSTILTQDSSRSIYISILKPKSPQVGINDFEITIHQKKNMMSFPAIDNYSVAIVPEMPSMGHGSPNNVNPINMGNGHYSGKVNFTMTGLWKVHLNIYKNDSLISNDQYFEMTLQ